MKTVSIMQDSHSTIVPRAASFASAIHGALIL